MLSAPCFVQPVEDSKGEDRVQEARRAEEAASRRGDRHRGRHYGRQQSKRNLLEARVNHH
jgi:hypothetical protein